jgi:hypothetical protein
MTRVELDNVLGLGLRIEGKGRQMNLKVRIQTNKLKLNVY